MPNYLSKADWRKTQKLKELKSVKKTGIGDILDDYAKAEKKKDSGAQVLALEKLQSKCQEIKGKYSSIKVLGEFLDNMIKEAKLKESRIANDLEAAAEDESLEGNKSPLGKALARLRQIDESSPHHFVLAPGKPSSGLVITRKSAKQSDVKSAIALRGKAGPFFQGSCHYEASKFTFVLADQPPKGLAKAIKSAARLHAEMNIKVRVRGGGIEYDDDSDEDLEEVGEARPVTRGIGSYPSALSLLEGLNKAKAAAPDKRADALSGIAAIITRAEQQMEGDEALSASDKRQLQKVYREVTAEIRKAARSRYPSAEDWDKLIEQVATLDAEQSSAALLRIQEQIRATNRTVTEDETLTEAQRTEEKMVLANAVRRLKERFGAVNEAGDAASGQDVLARFKKLDQAYQALIKQDVLPAEVLQSLKGQRDAIIEALRGKDFAKADGLLDTFEVSLGSATRISNEGKAVLFPLAEQNRIHQGMQQGTALFQKAAFASGTAAVLFKERDGVKVDKGLTKIAAAFRACEQDLSDKNKAALERECTTYLSQIDKALAKLDPNKPKDQAKRIALGRQRHIAEQALQRLRLHALAEEYQSLGAPPWDDEKADHAAELQAKFFFEEGTIKQESANFGGNFGAPKLSAETDEGGVNDAWWIERASPTSRGGKDTKVYIFKPQELEVSALPEMDQQGGAAREQAAKRLSDFLLSHGFDVGVCPTYLTHIERSALEGYDEAHGSGDAVFGSMQELADNKGSMGDLMEKYVMEKQADQDGSNPPANPFENLSQRSFNEVAVFDMLFLTIDRHQDNILLADDPTTGQTRMLPIDHGLALPSEDCLRLNRANFMGRHNVLMRDDYCGHLNNQLIDETTLQNLLAIDEDAMVAQMKQAQEAAARRHPELAGKIDPQAFDQMKQRLLFMKKAARVMPVKMLFEALASYPGAINAAKPDQLDALIQRIQTELTAKHAAAEDCRHFHNEAAGKYGADKLLLDLGWGANIDPEGFDAWKADNAVLIAKILKTKRENPQARRKVQQYQKAFNEPTFDQSIASMTLGDQLKACVEKAGLGGAHEAVGKALDRGEKGLRDFYESLGGDKALEEVRATFPGDEFLEAVPDDNLRTLANRTVLLQQWQRFQDLGGMKEFIRVGGFATEKLYNSVTMFEDLIELHKEKDAVLALTDQDVDQAQRAIVSELRKDIKKLMPDVKVEEPRKAFLADIAIAESHYKKQELTPAQGKFQILQSLVSRQATSEAKDEQNYRARIDQVYQLIDSQGSDQAAAVRRTLKAAIDAIEKDLAAHKFGGFSRKIGNLQADAEDEIQGDESPRRKAQARIVAIKQQASGLPQDHQGLAAYQNALQQAEYKIGEADLQNANAEITKCESRLNGIERIIEATPLVEGIAPGPKREEADQALQELQWSCDSIIDISRTEKAIAALNAVLK